MASSVLSSLLLLSVFAFTAFSCKDPQLNECGCMKRATFDSQWLNAVHPDIAEKYAKYEFEAPVVTYPECNAIIAQCPAGTQMANLQLASLTLTIGGVWANPTVVNGIQCDSDEHVWYKPGLTSSVDENLKSSTLSCAKAI